ncbi:hypothetical protein ACFX12_029917 [Malus domestica]
MEGGPFKGWSPSSFCWLLVWAKGCKPSLQKIYTGLILGGLAHPQQSLWGCCGSGEAGMSCCLGLAVVQLQAATQPQNILFFFWEF